MGQNTRGILPDKDGWQVDKWKWGKRFRQRGFGSFEEAEGWLIRELQAHQQVQLHGVRTAISFDSAAAHYLRTNQDKLSLATEAYLLQSVMPYIGHLELHQVHDSSLAGYVTARLAEGRAHKTINLALGVVRRILNLACTAWRDDAGRTWLDKAPAITMLPLVGHQREPRPITWTQQRQLVPRLPCHLARMSLFILNSGVRDDVACNLRWEWEIKIPELNCSVFEVPREHVKGRRRVRVVVCNSVAQSVIEACRGQHKEFVFVYRRERVKNLHLEAAQAYQPIERMNNSGWRTARTAAGLGDLHVHDLRHTVGMRLREAGVGESTIADLLWHSKQSMTHHYSVAQIVELHGALEKIKADSGAWNKSLHTLRLEQAGGFRGISPPEVPQQRKTA